MNTPTVTYDDVLRLAQKLEPQEQLYLLETLAMLVRQQIAPKSRRSILNLQGLGKELWQDIDAQAYI